ncbi:MAG: MFS transporter [Oleiphilus sp.]|nr:MAG: MFS transporter [Oleiphilus sp.]
MKPILLSIVSLLFGTAILLLGHGLAGTLLTLRSAAEQYSDIQIGMIMSAYFVGYIVGTWFCPALISRIGHIRAFTATAALCASLILLQGLWVNAWVWLLIRLIYGACIVSFYLIVESWLNARTDNLQRGRVFAIYMLVNLSAMALGQQLLLLGDVLTLELFAVAAALLSLSLVPVALTKLPEPEKVDKPGVDLSFAYHGSPVGLAGCLAAGLAGGAFWTMAPLFAFKVGLDTTATAAFMSATIIGGAFLQWPIGRYSDTHDRRKVLIFVALGSTIFAVLSMLSGNVPKAVMLGTMFLYGGLCFAVYPLSVAHANDNVSESDRVKLGGVLLLAYGIGAIFGPIIGGIVMQSAGPYSLPAFYAICWFLLALMVWRQLLRQHEPEGAELTAFTPLIRTSSESLQATAATQQPNER